MTRIAQQALTDAAQAMQQAGCSTDLDQDALEELLLSVRNRVRNSEQTGSLEVQRQGIVKAVKPIWHFIMAHPELMTTTVEVKSDLCWNLFAASIARTTCASAYPAITNDMMAWQNVIDMFVRGEAANPSGQEVFMGGMNIRALQVLVVGLAMLAAEGWVPSGRARVYIVGAGFLVCLAAFMLWYFDLGRPRTIVEQITSDVSRRVSLASEPGDILTVGEASRESAEVTISPPPLVPPLPSVSGGAVTQQAEFGQGSRVVVCPIAPYISLGGQTGTVTGRQEGKCDLRLDSGLELKGVTVQAIKAETTGSAPILEEAVASAEQVFAPYAPSGNGVKSQQQAGRLREALSRTSAMQATLPSWPALFWQSVKNESDLYGLDETVRKLLECHGYIGPGTIGPPRVEELKKGLTELETLGTPLHGAGAMMLQGAGGAGSTDPEHMQWHLRLPADMQRAAPELYRNIRAEGVASVRQWVNEQHPSLEQKQSPSYQDLFTAATVIDFELADCRSESAIMHKLATSDSLEIQLRKLGAFVYLRRTKDRAGAQRMLGVRAPGANADIAPKWMLDDANAFSKVEYQRIERGHKQNRYDGGQSSGGNTGGQTKYAGKFRGRGRGSGGGKGAKSKPSGGGGGKATQG